MNIWNRLKHSSRILFSGYDATKTTRKRRPRMATQIRKEELELTKSDRSHLIAHLLDYRRNHPIVKGICRMREQDVVGDGIRPRCDTGDKGLDSDLEGLWKQWTEEPEITGMGMREVQSLLASSTLIHGDCGLLLLENGGIQFIEGDQIGAEGDEWKLPEDPLKVDGIELDQFGRPVSFEIGTREDGRLIDVRKFPAESFLFHRKKFRGNQTRGIPELASVIDTLQDIKEYDETEMIAAKAAATMSAYVKREGGLDFELANREAEDSRMEYLEAGKVFYLEPNEDVGVISSNGRPNVDAIKWLTYKLRNVGTALGIPVEFLLMTIGETSFSASQGMVLLYQNTIEAEQRNLYPILTKLFRWKIAEWIREGNVSIPLRVDPFSHNWQPPSFRWINRSSQVQADQLYLQMGAVSLDDICSTFGKEAGEVMREKAKEIKMAMEIADELGLDNWRDIFNPIQTYGTAAIEIDQDEIPEKKEIT